MRTASASQINAQTSTQIQSQVKTPSRFDWKTAIVIAKFAFALLLVANMPTADATPAGYAACCATCIATFGPLTGSTSAGMLLPATTAACLKACIPVFGAPFP